MAKLAENNHLAAGSRIGTICMHYRPAANVEKAPSERGGYQSSIVDKAVRALSRKEQVLPGISAGVASIEHHHFVGSDIGMRQFFDGDLAHSQSATNTIEYQDLAESIVAA
ncbi:hypothetical protein ACWJ8Z_001358 [Pseudomonas aeruginosa]|uniref:hypothetical protein n=1 Tax=Pseudomonas aeruginosa TaxID=287 RepID=UPI0018920EA7|nr:hypothetical protein [Pseudomonas aeruginosa]HCI2598793.1 hypothetical protein [Pseudomonas aeruginosa]